MGKRGGFKTWLNLCLFSLRPSSGNSNYFDCDLLNPKDCDLWSLSVRVVDHSPSGPVTQQGGPFPETVIRMSNGF